MALKTMLFALVIGHSGTSAAPSVMLTQQVLNEGGFSSMPECRKLEASFHVGSNKVDKVGNKTVSWTESKGDTLETRTWCVEY